MKPAASPSKARRHYSKHGLARLKGAVRKRGTRAIDGRTRLGKALFAWRAALVTDLGGMPTLSTQQAELVELATRSKFLLDSVDAWLLQQPSLINARKRALLPVVRERAALVSQLAGLLKDLGLDRKVEPGQTVAELLRHLAPQAVVARVDRPPEAASSLLPAIAPPRADGDAEEPAQREAPMPSAREASPEEPLPWSRPYVPPGPLQRAALGIDSDYPGAATLPGARRDR